MVVVIADIDIAIVVDTDALWRFKLAIQTSGGTKRLDPCAIEEELLNPVVVGIDYIQMAGFLIDNTTIWMIKLTRRGSVATNLLNPDAIFVKLLDPMPPVVADIDIVIRIDGDVLRELDLLLARAIHAKGQEDIPIGGVLDHAVVPRIGDVEVALGIKDNAFRVLELPFG